MRDLHPLSSDLTAGYQLWRSTHTKGVGFVGVGAEKFEYQDSQEMPNHLVIDLKPELEVGLKVTF